MLDSITFLVGRKFEAILSSSFADIKLYHFKVEHVMREQNILAANEFIELFCELIAQRLTIIAKQRYILIVL